MLMFRHCWNSAKAIGLIEGLSNRYYGTGTLASKQLRRQLDDEQTELSKTARELTLSLYRTVMRSVRLLGECNENDKREFQQREEKRKLDLEDQAKDSRLSMISMLPAVNPEDELQSRVSYYKQYARENFSQESDCLDHERWEEDHISRFVYLIKRGEEHRKWLLLDMHFDDPYKGLFDLNRVGVFEKAALDFVGRAKKAEGNSEAPPHLLYTEADTVDPKDDDWGTDEDDSETNGVPAWYKNPRSE